MTQLAFVLSDPRPVTWWVPVVPILCSLALAVWHACTEPPRWMVRR